MSFLDHLEELRWHMVRAAIAIFLFMVGGFVVQGYLVDTILLGPTKTDFWTYQKLCEISHQLGTSDAFCVTEIPIGFISRKLTTQFTMSIVVSLLAGFIVAFPYVFFEIWRFVKPALHPTEARRARGAVFFVSLLFAIGLLFGYFVVAPLSVNFLANFTLSEVVDNQIDIASYVKFVGMIVLACALMFQLPMVSLFLSRAGLLTPDIMKAVRRHAFVVILLVAAFITPPDVISQLVLAMPIYLLYELGIIISRQVQKKNQKRIEQLREQNLQGYE